MNKSFSDPTPQTPRRTSARPPRWADRLLSWLTPPDLLEELQGDLHEQFAQRARQGDSWRARFWYGLEALTVIRPYYLRRRVASLANRQKEPFPNRRATTRPYFTPEYPSPPLLNPDMIRSYVKIAWRNLWKNKLFSVVNILSLSLSMAVGVILFTGLKATFDTDHFHPKFNQLVRILTQETTEGEQTNWATAPLPLATQLDSVSFVEKTVKVRLAGKHNLQTDRGDVPIDITFSEPSFFDVFGFKLLSGTAQSLANNSTTLLLTQKTAEKLFGSTNVVGHTVQVENLGYYTVGGIIQDPPLETHLPIEAMLSIRAAELLEKKGAISSISQDWGGFKSSAIYARLKLGGNIEQLNATLQHYNRKLDQSNLQFLAQPIEDITPGKIDLKNNPHAGTSWEDVKTQLVIILSLTLLAAFNYISLALARAFSRAQEVGVRKTIGATRGQVIGQFLMESTLVALFALAFTVPCVTILAHYIPDMDDVTFSWDITLLVGLITYALITGLVAGALPAWLLSAFEPIQVLRKMKTIKLFRGVAVYKGLIVVQFSVTILFMILVIIVADYDRKNKAIISSTVPSNVLTLDLKGENYHNMQNEISQLSQVETILATNWYYEPIKLGKDSVTLNDKTLAINYVSIDPRTIETEGIRLLAGQNFPKNMPQRTEQYVLVNEAAAKLLASKSATLVGQNLLLDSASVQVIGILPNEIIGQQLPLLYRYLPSEITTLTIKIKPSTEVEATKAIQSVWKDHFSQKTANLYNLKKYRYSGEINGEISGEMEILGGSALIVMIIAALGILGIASYSVETRTKELGIRKILGANNIKLVWLVTRNFGILMLLAGLIGVPGGLFCGDLLRKELGSYLDLGLINISIGFISVALVGLLTVLSQTIRAGQIEPVKVLKAE
ncbi:ABC transporter permease [Spirosoma endophyticum]|uniref:Putative ABC transport system permease protein n=1 Tax=Spirosoma endophyticum TaxID=662367 RepID=A0A1I1SK22_9BACT|nr:ABC transporter permease [Spirosoma endophyticum]SFD43380.1 putative ABC transport system permease protein [Spirosoma endophyticum]